MKNVVCRCIGATGWPGATGATGPRGIDATGNGNRDPAKDATTTTTTTTTASATGTYLPPLNTRKLALVI